MKGITNFFEQWLNSAKSEVELSLRITHLLQFHPDWKINRIHDSVEIIVPDKDRDQVIKDLTTLTTTGKET